MANVYVLDKKRAENEAHHLQKVEGAKTQTTIERAKAYMELLKGHPAQLQMMNITGQEASATITGIPAEALALQQRAKDQAAYENILHQLNRDAVSEFAAQALAEEETVSSDPVDQDWTTRFFSIVQDVSSEEMQALWGKILAGEIKKPNSYSLRTLDVVKNLSQDEAQAFRQAANYVIGFNTQPALCIGSEHDGQNILVDNGFPYASLLTLVDCGLVMADDVALHADSEVSSTMLKVGNKMLKYNNTSNKASYRLRVRALTQVGKELYKIIEAEVDSPIPYLQAIAKNIESDGTPTKWHTFIGYAPNDMFNFSTIGHDLDTPEQ